MHVQGLLICVLGCQSLLSAEYEIKRCLLAITSQKMPACHRKTRKLEQKKRYSESECATKHKTLCS